MLCYSPVVYHDAAVTFVTELLNIKNMLCYSPVVYHDAAVTFVTELLNMKNMLQYCGLPCCYCYICYRAVQHEKHVTVLCSTMTLLLHLLQSYGTQEILLYYDEPGQWESVYKSAKVSLLPLCCVTPQTCLQSVLDQELHFRRIIFFLSFFFKILFVMWYETIFLIVTVKKVNISFQTGKNIFLYSECGIDL